MGNLFFFQAYFYDLNSCKQEESRNQKQNYAYACKKAVHYFVVSFKIHAFFSNGSSNFILANK
jgi:hypothetical protein